MMTTAIGGIGQADQAYSAGQRNKAIDTFNANNATIQANQAIQAGADEANNREIRGEILKGAQQGAAAGGNTVATAGTNRIVQAGGQAASKMDQMMLEINASRAAFGFQVKAANLQFQGQEAGIAGNEAALAALVKTGATEEEESDPNYRGRGSASMAGVYADSDNTGGSGSIFSAQV
jgi:hypothetical protein